MNLSIPMDILSPQVNTPSLIIRCFNDLQDYTARFEAMKDFTTNRDETTPDEVWLLQHQDDEIVVNLTGGTKLMSIAAYQIFSGYGFRCFYQNLNPNQLIWLDDESIISDIGTKISLERYLKSYQFDVVKKQKLNEVHQSYKKYTKLIYQELSKAGRWQQTCQLISKLNAHTAKPQLSDLKNFTLDYDEESFLTHLSYETDLFELTAKSIEWQTEQDRAFIAGGWLEYLTASLLVAENIRDISLSVEIAKSTQRVHAKTHQEIDVMAMQQQQLLIIECKTVNWKNATQASEAIYKLSALRDIGGLNTKAVFVSLYDLPAKVSRLPLIYSTPKSIGLAGE